MLVIKMPSTNADDMNASCTGVGYTDADYIDAGYIDASYMDAGSIDAGCMDAWKLSDSSQHEIWGKWGEACRARAMTVCLEPVCFRS